VREGWATVMGDSITLTLSELETMLHEPVRDKRYLDTRLGPSVRAYLSWKENEAGAAERTLDQYERDLARLCIMLADHDVRAVTTDELRQVRDTFPKGSRKRVTAAYRDFWRWLYQEGRIDRDPMARVRYPKRGSVPVLDVFTAEEEARLITAQTRIRDRVGVAILLDAGVRASEIRHVRVQDVDLAERWIIVRRGKGGKGRVVPIRGRVVVLLEEFLLTPIPKLNREPALSDFVLYPTGAGPHGPTWSDPSRCMAPSTFWRWWKACCERASIRYRKPHTSRHTYATKLIRASRDVAAVQKALGHASVRTTIDVYTHLQVTDVARAVEAMETARISGAEGVLRKDSAQDEENPLQRGSREAPTRIELVYEALQASA
jgi:integrase/recombinase XerD